METSPIDIFDLLLSPFYIIAVFIIASYYQRLNFNVRKKEHYRYFLPALMCKIVGGISLCLIYTYYYVDGGDVTNYYYTCCTYVNVFLSGDFSRFWNLISFNSIDTIKEINSINTYGLIYFNFTDNYAFFTVLLTTPFCILACKSFIATTILLASFSFIGLWKLYEVFVAHFSDLSKEFAIAIFFIPSVFFGDREY